MWKGIRQTKGEHNPIMVPANATVLHYVLSLNVPAKLSKSLLNVYLLMHNLHRVIQTSILLHMGSFRLS